MSVDCLTLRKLERQNCIYSPIASFMERFNHTKNAAFGDVRQQPLKRLGLLRASVPLLYTNRSSGSLRVYTRHVSFWTEKTGAVRHRFSRSPDFSYDIPSYVRNLMVCLKQTYDFVRKHLSIAFQRLKARYDERSTNKCFDRETKCGFALTAKTRVFAQTTM